MTTHERPRTEPVPGHSPLHTVGLRRHAHPRRVHPPRPDAGPDRDRRWIAGVSCGLTYLSFAPLVGVVVAVATAAPPGIVETIAGLALLATFASSMFAALADPAVREPAAMAIVVAASGITIAGIGAAFWALLAGLVLHAVLTRRPA